MTPRTLSADEFEYLALMGRTQVGDIIVGEGGAERVLHRAKQLALAPDDVLDVYVPGRLRCPKYKFELMTNCPTCGTKLKQGKGRKYCPRNRTHLQRTPPKSTAPAWWQQCQRDMHETTLSDDGEYFCSDCSRGERVVPR